MKQIIPVAQALSATVPLKDIQHYMRPGTLRLPVLPPLSLYVHLPWCLRKCPYCDFNSHEFRAGGAAGELPEQRYIDALVADLEASLPLVWGRPVHSIFIGGGTPSLFSPQAIDRLLGDIRARLPLTPDCEITLEANPGTFEKGSLQGVSHCGRDAPVGRRAKLQRRAPVCAGPRARPAPRPWPRWRRPRRPLTPSTWT
jgi:coproporphyrinogen III oxidase-like Fe-S oxidoreductase